MHIKNQLCPLYCSCNSLTLKEKCLCMPTTKCYFVLRSNLSGLFFFTCSAQKGMFKSVVFVFLDPNWPHTVNTFVQPTHVAYGPCFSCQVCSSSPYQTLTVSYCYSMSLTLYCSLSVTLQANCQLLDFCLTLAGILCQFILSLHKSFIV